MHNLDNETGGTEVRVTDEVITPGWPAVLARFTVSASVERLVHKKERELEPEELVRFMDAAVRRLEELAGYQG
ncbi:hypothetical protein [Enterobacter hormaechei]|uniref:hypothetical protein n=1 Tax=Enterobacter hormaechei TaxID=158836 RepID=UPI001F26CA2F|nr:hypothetical protein [Enterobacter hormaechei]